jgi:hypothetical protein
MGVVGVVSMSVDDNNEPLAVSDLELERVEELLWIRASSGRMKGGDAVVVVKMERDIRVVIMVVVSIEAILVMM